MYQLQHPILDPILLLPVVPRLASGSLEVKKSSLIWKIDRFSEQCKVVGNSIESKIFHLGYFGTNKVIKWKIELYPFGQIKECEDHLSVCLNFIPDGDVEKTTLAYCWELSILDTSGNNVNTLKNHSTVGQFQKSSPSWGWEKFIKRSDLFLKKATLLKEDVLTISLSLKEYVCSSKKDNDASSILVKQYESLYLSEEFSDVTIVIQDKEIKAHKCILSSKSKVFSAMLKHNMEESNSSIIKIIDVDYDVMKEFLLFVYCGKIPNIKKFAKSLLLLSDKYDVTELKQICERSLWEDVTVDNACEILSMADVFDCKELKSDVMTYIVTNIKEILNTKSFDEISNSNIVLLKEILCELVKQRID